MKLIFPADFGLYHKCAQCGEGQFILMGNVHERTICNNCKSVLNFSRHELAYAAKATFLTEGMKDVRIK